MPVNLWQPPSGEGIGPQYRWALRLMQLFQQGKHKDYHALSVTLTAGTSTSVADTKIAASDTVFLTPTNAAARAIEVHVGTITPGTGFALGHATAAGTETYNALVIR